MKTLLFTEVHRSLYGALVRELWEDLARMQEQETIRPVTPAQSRALFIVAAMLERLGTRML